MKNTRSARFNFPGFNLQKQDDNDVMEIEIGTINSEGVDYTIHTLRKKGLPFVGEFMISKVFGPKPNEDLLWQFHAGAFDGFSFLAKAEEEVVIALVSRGRYGKVEDVIPLSALMAHKPVGLRRKVWLKEKAAEFLGRDFSLTLPENRIFKKDVEKRREEREARLAEEKARREHEVEEQRKLRQQKINSILGRTQINCFTADGQKRYGVPALENEWRCLPAQTFVILVEKYNQETDTAEGLIESFSIFKKKGCNPQKLRPAKVYTGKVGHTVLEMPKPVETIVVETEEDAYEVLVFASFSDVQKARAAGLNNGTMVTSLDKKDGDRFEIFSVKSDEVVTVGLFEALA